jgi:hypothetical protein
MTGYTLFAVGLGSPKIFFLILGRESMRWQSFVGVGLGLTYVIEVQNVFFSK